MASFWVGKRGGDFPPTKDCFLSEMGYFSFYTPFKKGMGMVFFLKGRESGPFQRVVSWVAWKGGGWVVYEGKGVDLFSFSPLFERAKWSRKEV
jgi:hypothetical protein